MNVHPFQIPLNMIRTKIIASGIKDVPLTWIFEYYLKLDQKLDGKEIKITSIFNPSEKTPSMVLYISKDGKYRFTDFSSGNKGGAIDMVSMLYGMTVGEAATKILYDYNNYIVKGGNDVDFSDFKKQSKYQVTDYTARNWNSLDAKYWMHFGIGSKMLARYNVMPLESHVMDNGEKKFVIKGNYMYGYFREDGLMYKIYQPKTDGNKFIKVRNCIQGMEQLTYKKPNLIIHSSLKDLMAFEAMGFKTIECIAPDSENTFVPEDVMWQLIGKYETVITLFDNDDAGKKAVIKYREKYGINGTTLNMEKDVADSVARYGRDNVKDQLVPLLTECIHTCRRCPESSTSV